MSRSAGKRNTARIPRTEPDTPEGDYIGLSDRQSPGGSPIPGLTGNIVNYETVRQRVPVGESFPEYEGMMAHGVQPGDETTEERAQMIRGDTHGRPSPPKLAKPRTAPLPVPVYLVEPSYGGRAIRTFSSGDGPVTVPASGGQAIRICSRDTTRDTMFIMVETAAGASGAAPTGIRIDHEVGVVESGRGALIRAGGSSWQEVKGCQDSLYAISNDGSACTVTVAYLYGVPAAG